MLPVCSGIRDPGTTTSVTKYNITSGERSALPSLPQSVGDHACAVFNNTIIVSGGGYISNYISTYTNKVWELDLQAGEWKPLPSLNQARSQSLFEM